MSAPSRPAPFTPRWAAAVVDPGLRGTGGARPPFSFSYGLPDPALFPTVELEAAAAQVLRAQSDRALQYGSGAPELAAGLVARLNRAEGLALEPDQCLISAGASQALGLAARALVDPGDPVLLETPAWTGVQAVLRRCRARVVPVPLDADGPDLAALEQALVDLDRAGTRPRLFYTVPSFQNPTGVTMTLERRQALLALCRRWELLILEDDAYRDLAFDSAPPPSLLALDADGRVLRVGTYSKILAPGLRLGWVLGPPAALAHLGALRDGEISPFTTYLAAAYQATGALDRHIAGLIDAYRAKRDAMLAALAAHMPPGVTWTVPAGGFFVWLGLPSGHDAAKLLERCRAAGVDFLPGRACCPAPTDGTRFLRLAFSLLPEAEIAEGIRRLAAAVAASG